LQERSHAEELESTRELLTAILEASPFSIISTDLDGIVRYFNPASERLIGIKASEAVGRPIYEVTRVTPEEYAGLYAQLIRGDIVRLDPIRRYQKDGTPIDERSAIAPLKGPHGAIVGAVSITEDVTEKLQLEAELGQSQKMETLGQLSGAIAHDFNNLLQAIRGCAELAAATAPKGSDLGTNLHEIQRAADRATELTRQLLAFSQPSLAGARVVDINDSISEAVPMIRRLVGPTISLTTILDPAAGRVMIDPTRLEQAILNLSVNGRDAMPHGGSLTIETRGGVAPNTVTISVADTGTGMPQAVVGRIFEPFFTTKETGQGTGLGLPIVRRIVNGAGGDVVVESEIGQGTLFRLSLPTVPGEAAETAASVDADLRGSETILLVEDEASIRRLALRVLGDHGYIVHTAANADEARELWSKHGDRVDLLLSDVTMPGLSGPAFAAELARSRPIRILFVSGHLSSDPAELQLTSGAGFLQKPFTVAALLRAVREALASSDESASV
jgi:two-component system, cell cycle sensor histidine kinase and response regulator CckA